jgi:hypothetical protein
VSKISLSKELLAQPAQDRGTRPWRYAGAEAPADCAPRARARELAQPVTLARELIDRGASPRVAHAAVTRLAETLTRPPGAGAGGPAPPGVTDPAAFEATLAELGVAAERRGVPETVDVAAIRSRLGPTRRSFAIRFGLDPRTAEAWEQGPLPAGTDRPHPAQADWARPGGGRGGGARGPAGAPEPPRATLRAPKVATTLVVKRGTSCPWRSGAVAPSSARRPQAEHAG